MSDSRRDDVPLPDEDLCPCYYGREYSCRVHGPLSSVAAAMTTERDVLRRFETGATRDSDEGKFDYEGFLSPLVVQRYGAYLHKHRIQSDGSARASDNWQKGIPLDAYMKSGWRHFMDWWLVHRGHEGNEDIEDALCALIFNASGYLHELLKEES